MRPITHQIDGKEITVYSCGEIAAPVVIVNDFEDSAKAILTSAKELECQSFHLVTITGLSWDEELSPWPENPVISDEDHFEGRAPDYLWTLEENILPWVRTQLPEATKFYLAGYSMAGIFALYAAEKSDSFAGYICASGSVWYPGFVAFAEENASNKTPPAIYLSLGDRESRTRHPYLSTTEDNMRRLQEIYDKRGTRTTFVLNPGNHFKNPPRRLAKGIAWILE